MFLQNFQQLGGSIPTRFNVAVMLFITCLIAYVNRVNVSVNILAMVHSTGMIQETQFGNETNVSQTVPDYGPRYDWNVHDQSMILGAFFYGYLCTQLAGGVLAEKFGGRLVIFSALCLLSICTALAPILAEISLWAFIGGRIALGLASGVLYPAIHNVVSKWAPPEEKGKFISCVLGGALGTVLTWAMVGFIIESLGWIWAFYIPAVISFLCAFLWWYIVADSPAKHPRITKEEKDFIEKSLGDQVTDKKAWLPVKQILTCIPFWALCFLHFGNNWGLYFLLTAAPKYMNEVLGFKLAKAGFLSALPYLARLFSGFIFGAVGDCIRKKNCISVTTNRKLFTICSHVIPGAILCCIPLIENNPYAAVALITLSLGFNGSATLTNLQNSQDLAPNFAGSLYGIVNFVGTFTGFLSPMLVAYFTQNDNSARAWTDVFLISGAIYIIPAVIFILFGSGEIQKWNQLPDDNQTSESDSDSQKSESKK